MATMKNATIFDLTLCGSCRNKRFGGTYYLRRQFGKSAEQETNMLQVADTCSIETSVHIGLHGPESLKD
jgi:hypothetical protein